MRFTTLSNYYLIDWWCDVDFCLFPCWFDFWFCYSCLTWETDGLELASTIILLLQVSWLTKSASLPKCASHQVCNVSRISCYLQSQNPIRHSTRIHVKLVLGETVLWNLFSKKFKQINRKALAMKTFCETLQKFYSC